MESNGGAAAGGTGGGGGGGGGVRLSTKPSRLPILYVLHDFEARSPDELSLKKGDMVELLADDEEFGDGWYTGRDPKTDRRGLFPQVYTRPLPPEALTPIAEANHNDSGEEIAENSVGTGPSSSTLLKKETAMTETHPEENSVEDSHQATPTIGGVSTPTLKSQPDHKVDTLPYPFSAKTHDLDPPETPPLSVTKPGAALGGGGGVPSSTPSLMSEYDLDQQTRYYAPQNNVRSPVVEDTLSDIEEAISELSISRNSRDSKMMKHHNSRTSRERMTEKPLTVAEIVHPDSSSEYSRINEEYLGSTDDEDGGANLNLADAKQWTPAQVSDYLQSCGIGIEQASKFEDQEISGAIALQLEHQHLKELDLGSFGKRFEVWKVLEELQKKVAAITARRSEQARTGQIPGLSIPETGRKRSSTIGTPSSRSSLRSGKLSHQIDVREANKRIMDRQWLLHTPAAPHAESPPFERPRSPPMHPQGRQSTDSARRSAQPTKRLSSAESWSATGLNAALMTGTAVLHAGSSENKYHSVQPSGEHDPWANPIVRPSTATGVRSTHKTSSVSTEQTADSGYYGSMRASDKSYFSGGEGLGKERKVLHKKAHGRKPSYTEEQRARSATSHSRHSRVNSSETVNTPPTSSKTSSTVLPPTSILSSAVGVIKDVTKRKSNSFSMPASEQPQFVFSNNRLSPTPNTAPFLGKRGITDPGAASENEGGSRSAGLPQRTVSECTDRSMYTSPTSLKKVDFGGTESTVSTPSITTTVDSDPARRTLDDDELKEKEQRLRNASSANALRGKKKHQTSAWLEGLRQISPAEAAAEADFSGWMQKRGSGAIAATWKPRFFVLKGKRLSYFYSESDTKERGLIDITSHRVLPATEDRLVNMHATLAAVTSPHHTPSLPTSPFSPNSLSPAASTPGTPNPDAPAVPSGKPKKESWFTFKLVPPAPGASKGVTFTPPKLHYFATSTRAEGKAWMGALLKATIERDETKPIVSSFSAKTISLKKARELRARPPDLDEDADGRSPGSATTADRFGLGLAIEGLADGKELEVELAEKLGGGKVVNGVAIT